MDIQPVTAPAVPINWPWATTTVLGVVAAIIVALDTPCLFGPIVCRVLDALAVAIPSVLGVTHPGFKVPQK